MERCIELKGDGGTLILEPAVNDLGWTPCTLMISDTHIYLGADTLSCVTAGLLKAVGGFDVEADGLGQISGTPVRHALHLEEAHHSLYFGDQAGTRLLFWQSEVRPPLAVVGTIRLSSAQRREWAETLECAGAARSLAGSKT